MHSYLIGFCFYTHYGLVRYRGGLRVGRPSYFGETGVPLLFMLSQGAHPCDWYITQNISPLELFNHMHNINMQFIYQWMLTLLAVDSSVACWTLASISRRKIKYKYLIFCF